MRCLARCRSSRASSRARERSRALRCACRAPTPRRRCGRRGAWRATGVASSFCAQAAAVGILETAPTAQSTSSGPQGAAEVEAGRAALVHRLGRLEPQCPLATDRGSNLARTPPVMGSKAHAEMLLARTSRPMAVTYWTWRAPLRRMARGHGWRYGHCRPTHDRAARGGAPNVQLISSHACPHGFAHASTYASLDEDEPRDASPSQRRRCRNRQRVPTGTHPYLHASTNARQMAKSVAMRCQVYSGCHCTPRQKRADGTSIASGMPSVARATRRTPSPILSTQQ